MATSKKEYKSLAKTTSIRCTSRASIQVKTPKGDSYYTMEYSEERSVPENADIEKERALLWDVCNSECDSQIEDVLKAYRQ